jgi:hypothetical protein
LQTISLVLLLLVSLGIVSLLIIGPIASVYQTAIGQQCHPSLWEHVYTPNRLTKVKDCITVTGTIHSQKIERDGDIHLTIAVDSKFKHLLTPGNYIGKGGVKTSGYLVAEVVCQKQPKFHVAIAACQPKTGTYLHHIPIPPDGSHVCITGSLVHDKNHPPQYPKGWAEIHPVSNLKKC